MSGKERLQAHVRHDHTKTVGRWVVAAVLIVVVLAGFFVAPAPEDRAVHEIDSANPIVD